MTTRRERMVSDLDREIAAAEATLHSLKAARRALAPFTRARKAKRAPDAQHAFEEGSLSMAAATVMKGGRSWHVAEVHKAIEAAGVPTERTAVNSMLYRASRREGSRFEKVGRGTYRLRQRAEQREGTTLPQ